MNHDAIKERFARKLQEVVQRQRSAGDIAQDIGGRHNMRSWAIAIHLTLAAYVAVRFAAGGFGAPDVQGPAYAFGQTLASVACILAWVSSLNALWRPRSRGAYRLALLTNTAVIAGLCALAIWIIPSSGPSMEFVLVGAFPVVLFVAMFLWTRSIVIPALAANKKDS